MKANIGHVVAGSGGVLMAVALVAMVLDLQANVVPGAPWMVALSLGLVAVVAALVWRFEQAAAQQRGLAVSLLDVRRRRAELALGQQTDKGIPQAIIAA